MNFENLESQYATLFSFNKENENKYNIICPFFRVDGSMLDIYLIKKNNKFYLSDDGYTLTNLNCFVDVDCEDCSNLIKEICAHFNIKRLADGSFEKEITEENFFIILSQFANFCSEIENLTIFFN